MNIWKTFNILNTGKWYHSLLVLFFIRWNRAKGDTIKTSDTFWDTNQPNVKEFDYTTRSTSPITQEAYDKCSSNPAYGCSINEKFSCTQESGKEITRRPTFNIRDEADTSSFCSSDDGCKAAVNSLFVNFDLVKATTFDASPACMAILGPDVDDTKIEAATEENPNYDECGLLFEFSASKETYDYAKYFDLKCNQRTRALMCSIIGNLMQPMDNCLD